MRNRPVLAAGIVASGKGLAAALALGAQGVVMGTQFVATKEYPISDNREQWLLEHTEKDTVLVQKSIHNAARIANSLAARPALGVEAGGTTLQGLMTVISGKLSKQCYENGNTDGGIYTLGPTMGLIQDIETVQELTDGMVDETEAVINGLRPDIC